LDAIVRSMRGDHLQRTLRSEPVSQ
jgi:hypothetical protein